MKSMATKAPSQENTDSLSTEDIYNFLMAEIEPELTTYMIPHLDEIYAEETKREREQRAKGYNEAFAEFWRRFDKAMKIWKEQILKFRDAGLSFAKEKAGKQDTEKLSDIERSLDEL
jgi:hypothetical protein